MTETPIRTWAEIWDTRRLDPSKETRLAQLMAADGLDTGFGSVSETSWRAFVRGIAHRLDLGRGTSAFEVGCGAGAFLFDLYEHGVRVAGVDQSAALVGFAGQAMPDGEFHIGAADDFSVRHTYDAVLSCGVFLYFASLDYASKVIDRMVASSHGAIAILDVPDAARREAAMVQRRGALGAEEYARRYSGLDHQYYDKGWMVEALASRALLDIHVEDQQIDGYANAAYRFNIFARVRSSDPASTRRGR